MAKPIDLQIKPSLNRVSDDSKPYYPSIEVEGEFEVGDEVTITGVVKRVVEDDDTCRCTIECQEMECCDDEGLDGAMEKIAKKKVRDSDEE